MGRYNLNAIPLREYGKYEMLRVIASFQAGANTADRQQTIDYLVRKHGIDLTTTKSVHYDPTFVRRPGENVNGDIRIGPHAFAQDASWLASVVFHEVVHSDQFAFYAKNGIVFGKRAVASEAERIMVALDEFEGFFWPWYNRSPLGLSKDQEVALTREVALWRIEIDDGPTVALANKGKFDEARLALIGRLPKP